MLSMSCQTSDTKEEIKPYDEFPGLSAPVEIRIDTRGIPHIYGQTDDDVFYASGYQMASKRLFQMDLARRRALGTQAEVLGESKVDQDIVSRMFQLRENGLDNIERMRAERPDVYNLFVAWTAGVNRRIAEVNAGQAEMPIGFDQLGYQPEPWELEDMFAIAQLFYLGNTNAFERELLGSVIRKLSPDFFAELPLCQPAFPAFTLPPEERPSGAAPSNKPLVAKAPPAALTIQDPVAFERGMTRILSSFEHVSFASGSNNWAIDGQHTDNGRPIIANDPHQGLQSPSLMYAQHLNSADAKGRFDVIGFSFAGSAGVQLGHNRKIQWAATTNFGDAMDLWDVELVGDAAKVGGSEVQMEVREETIAVANGASRVVTFRNVPGYGFIVPDDLLTDLATIGVFDPGHAVMLNWSGFDSTGEETGFVGFSLAESLSDFNDAVDTTQIAGFNFLAASAEGISYRVRFRIPDRGQVSADRLPYVFLDADDPATLWDGTWLSPDKMPTSTGGTRGWIATANNDPWGFTEDGDITNDPWYYGCLYASGLRAHSLDEKLAALVEAGGVTVEQNRQLQTDTSSPLREPFLTQLNASWAKVGTKPELDPYVGRDDLQTLITALQEWDGHYDLDSSGAVIFRLFALFLLDEIARDDMPLLYNEILDAETPFALKFAKLTITGEYPTAALDLLIDGDLDEMTLSALDRSAQFLVGRFGDSDPAVGDYAWSDMHGTRFDNAASDDYEVGFVPTSGSDDTINVSTADFVSGSTSADRWDSTDGAIFRVVTSFDDDGTPRAAVNFPPGNDAEPDSPHWDDTLADWVDGVYTQLPFSRAEVEAATESVIMLEPE